MEAAAEVSGQLTLLEAVQERRNAEQLEQAFNIRCKFCNRRLRSSSKQYICTRRFGCRKTRSQLLNETLNK